MLVEVQVESIQRATNWLGRRRLWAKVVDGREIHSFWLPLSVARLSAGQNMIGGWSCD